MDSISQKGTQCVPEKDLTSVAGGTHNDNKHINGEEVNSKSGKTVTQINMFMSGTNEGKVVYYLAPTCYSPSNTYLRKLLTTYTTCSKVVAVETQATGDKCPK